MVNTRPIVFISYSHDSDEHAARVRGLAASLSRDGCDCRLDVYKETDDDWPTWMTNQLLAADFVLCVVTETYYRRYRDQEPPDVGLGVGWEASLIRRQLYAQKFHNARILPVLFAPDDKRHIPLELQGYDFFQPDDGPGYEGLLRRLLKQPAYEKPTPGAAPWLKTEITEPLFPRPRERLASVVVPSRTCQNAEVFVGQEELNRLDDARTSGSLCDGQSFADAQEIRHRLGMDRTAAEITTAIRTSLTNVAVSPLFSGTGLCSGVSLEPRPEAYFVAQEFVASRSDLRESLSRALGDFGVHPCCADDNYRAGHILCKICALIQSTPFGVYHLTSQENRNVYLEVGISLGLSRPFVLVRDADAEIPELMEGMDYYRINSYLELQYELARQVSPFLVQISRYSQPPLPPPGSRASVLVSHGDIDVIDFCMTAARYLAQRRLTAVIQNDPTGKLAEYFRRERLTPTPEILGTGPGTLKLQEILAAIQAARFGIFRIDKGASTNAFLALGMSLGLGRPGILTHETLAELPTDVRGLTSLSFASFGELTRRLAEFPVGGEVRVV
jgi:hypothetical protein